MTLGTAHDLSLDATLHTDVCVIGSGAAGLTIACELDGGPLDVLVLEAGGAARDLAIERDLFEIEQLDLPYLNPEPPRARFFGGSTNLWFGRVATLDPIDFEQRPWVEHSGWPIAYDEMWPWIERAARILAVPHFDKIDPRAWASNATVETFDRAHGAELGVFLWSNAMIMAQHHRRQIERSRNVKVLLDATVTNLLPNDGGGAIESLTGMGPGGERFTVRARAVVLAAGGLENPRLLLASTERSPAGVGNPHDLVGCFYMDHPRGEGLATADLRDASDRQLDRLLFLGERTSSEHGPVQLRVKFSADLQRAEQLLNHGLHAHLVVAEQSTEGFQSAKRLAHRLRSSGTAEATPLRSELRNVVRDAPSLAKLVVKKATGRMRPSSIVFIDQMEQPPDAASRITVDHLRRDRYGLPQIQTRWRIDDSTYESQRRMHELIGTILRDVGITTFRSQLLDSPGDRPELWDMKHPSGTTRMATSPDRGVVDADGRVHGLDNLYVAGSSVFPTVGHANPTLTLVALAARLAELLRRRYAASGAARVVPERTARLGVGCARLGEATNGVSWRQAIRTLRNAADEGVTFFDTADAYTSGTSERLLGEAFGGRRDDVTIATKAGYVFRERSRIEARGRFLAGPILRRLGRGAVATATGAETQFAAQDFEPDSLRAALDASLRRLRTDHVDVFQLHAPRHVEVDRVIELVAELKEAGKIGRFGIGVEQLSETEPWVDVPGLDSIQLPFSVLDGSAEPIIARARGNGVSIIARSVLGQGSLAKASGVAGSDVADPLVADLRACAERRGITLQQLAIAYAAGYPGVDVVLVGVRLPAHLTALLASTACGAPDSALLADIDTILGRHRTASGRVQG